MSADYLRKKIGIGQEEEKWEKMFCAFKEQKEKNGNSDYFPSGWYVENEQLATWLEKQRAKYRNGTLGNDYIRHFEDIRFEWAQSRE